MCAGEKVEKTANPQRENNLDATPMASSSTHSKKRKRDGEDADKVSLQISSASTSQVGPVLGTLSVDNWSIGRLRLILTR